jgi:hypothetical protein
MSQHGVNTGDWIQFGMVTCGYQDVWWRPSIANMALYYRGYEDGKVSWLGLAPWCWEDGGTKRQQHYLALCVWCWLNHRAAQTCEHSLHTCCLATGPMVEYAVCITFSRLKQIFLLTKSDSKGKGETWSGTANIVEPGVMMESTNLEVWHDLSSVEQCPCQPTVTKCCYETKLRGKKSDRRWSWLIFPCLVSPNSATLKYSKSATGGLTRVPMPLPLRHTLTSHSCTVLGHRSMHPRNSIAGSDKGSPQYKLDNKDTGAK